MQESFVIKLWTNNRPLPIAWVNRGWTAGAVLNDEFSAFPRSFHLHLEGADKATATAMKKIGTREGWPSGEFRLQRFLLDDGSIGFRGARTDTLPAGDYLVSVLLWGFRESLDLPLRIEEGGQTTIDIDLPGDVRLVELDREISQFDPEIQRVVNDANSTLDTRPLRSWLFDESRTPARRACLLNLLAKLRSVPNRDTPLIRHVESVFFCDIDRVYASVTPGFQAQWRTLASRKGASGTHRKLLKWKGLDKTHKLDSYREPTTGLSMQCTLAVDKGNSTARFADLDIDLANPEIDLVRFFKHVGEVLDQHPTDHLALRDKLASEPAGEFLYYRVVAPV